MKKKGIAGTFALIFGMVGLHRFYLGQRFLGFLYIIAFSIALIGTIESDGIPFILFVALVGLMDALLIWAMPREDFNVKFNSGVDHHPKSLFQRSRRERKTRRNEVNKAANPYKASGIQKFRDYDVEGALKDFKKATELDYEDQAIHFNLACCYSFLEEEDPAFFHLSKAIEFGFVHFDRIANHDALAFLRTSERFKDFAGNGYRYGKKEFRNTLPAPKNNLLESTPSLESENNLLEQIEQLGMLREKGILTKDEFELQKKKLMNLG